MLYSAIHVFCTVPYTGSLQSVHCPSRRIRGQGLILDQSVWHGEVNQSFLVVCFLGGELYGKLTQVLQDYVQEVRDEATRRPRETLLEFYEKEWNHYVTVASSNNYLFRYLNRTWVKQQVHKGKKNVYDACTCFTSLCGKES